MEHVLPKSNSFSDERDINHVPFLIRVEHLDTDERGSFRPAAFVRFASSLRTSGLLAGMSPEGVRDLLMLLTFVSPNGVCAPHIEQLAEALRVPVAKARNRFERLAGIRFQGQKLVAGNQRPNGLETYSPLPRLAPVREDGTPHHSDTAQPVLYAAPRQVVIDHSRATYGRPRAEVEREVEKQLGHYRLNDGIKAKRSDISDAIEKPLDQLESESNETAELRNSLLRVGLLPEQVETLLARHDLLSIRRQLAWLPHRGAKNPAGFLMAAVKDNYEAPPTLRPATDLSSPSPVPEVDVASNDLEVSLKTPDPHQATDEAPLQT